MHIIRLIMTYNRSYSDVEITFLREWQRIKYSFVYQFSSGWDGGNGNRYSDGDKNLNKVSH